MLFASPLTGLYIALLAATTTVDVQLANLAMQGDIEGVRSMLAQNVDVNAAPGDGMTALHWAASRDDMEMAQLLLRAGANVNAATRVGALPPLLLAAENGNAEMVDAFLKAGGNANSADTTGTTALMKAALSGSTAAIKILLEHRANPNARDSVNGQTALMFAAWRDRAAAIKALVEGGADMRITSKILEIPPDRGFRDPLEDGPIAWGQQPKRAAAATGGSNTEPKERKGNSAMGGMTALIFASRDGRLNAVRALVEVGADVNQISEADDSSPLLIAISNGFYTIAQYLVNHGADPNLANVDGITPLWATVNTRYAPVGTMPIPRTDQEIDFRVLLKQLLDHGASPNARSLKRRPWFILHDQSWLVSENGSTAFWRAAEAGDVEAMRILVAGGADPNLRSDGGESPLMMAAGLGFVGNFTQHAPEPWLAAVKYLVEELASDVNAVDLRGYTVMHGAALHGDIELIRYLVDKGAKVDGVATAGQGKGRTVADMANGPQFYSVPFPEAVALLEKLGSKNSHNCISNECVGGNRLAPETETAK